MKRLTLITGIENEHCKDILCGLFYNEFKVKISNFVERDYEIDFVNNKLNRVLFWPENKTVADFLDYSHQEPLHPSKQVSLLNTQIKDMTNNPNLNIFILTQSEYIFNAIRVACRKELIDFNDVEVIWCSGKYSDFEIPGEFKLGDDPKDYFMIDSIEIDKDGRCKNWPRGFFDVTDGLLFELLK